MPIDPAAYRINSLANLLSAHNHGDDLARADDLYRKVMQAIGDHVQEHGGKAAGSIAITFTFTGDAKGVDVVTDIKHTLPKPPKQSNRYFLTNQGDGLTLQDPARETMFAGQNLGRRAAGDAKP